jgi:hypothetical protein
MSRGVTERLKVNQRGFFRDPQNRFHGVNEAFNQAAKRAGEKRAMAALGLDPETLEKDASWKDYLLASMLYAAGEEPPKPLTAKKYQAPIALQVAHHNVATGKPNPAIHAVFKKYALLDEQGEPIEAVAKVLAQSNFGYGDDPTKGMRSGDPTFGADMGMPMETGDRNGLSRGLSYGGV